MHKGTMMGLCLMAVLGAVVLEVNASPDTDPISMLPDFALDGFSVFKEQCMKKTEKEKNEIMDRVMDINSNIRRGITEQKIIREKMIRANDEKSWEELNAYIDENCKKATEIQNYSKELTNTAQVCLTPKWKQHLETSSRILASLARFQCSLSRDEIAPYVELKDICPNFKRETTDTCLYMSFPSYPSGNNSKPLMLFFSPTFCVDLQRFESCVLHFINRCIANTPVNIAKSIFEILKNETNCQAIVGQNTTASGNKPSQDGFLVAVWVGIGLLIGTFYNRHS